MKGRFIWILAAALVLAAILWWRSQSHSSMPAKPKPEVAIQDGKSIDFSSGTAVVKDDEKSKATIDRSVKEMEEATKNVTFGPTAKTTADKKTAEPPVAPPKS